MSPHVWLSELNRILLVFIPCAVSGVVTGHLPLFLILGFIVYVLWSVRQFATLKKWLDNGAVISQAPEYLGLADQHVSSIIDLQKSHQVRQSSLQEFVAQFNEMIAALPDAVVVMAASGEILSANQAAHKLLRIDAAIDSHTRITQLVRDPLFTDYFFARDFDQPLEIRSTTANEPELNLRIISFGEDRLVLIAQDMSQMARVYAMRRSFISNASHELRTPLTVILGYLETLQRHPELPGDCQAAVQSAELQAQRMQQLVTDLLTLSRLESMPAVAEETNLIPVTSVITETVKEAKLTAWFAGHNIQVYADTEAMLKGELQEIRSVISNLVNNAVKYTEMGTNVEITWRLVGEDAAELVVKDDAAGITPEHIGRLTERFYRVDTGRSRQKGGTGLGLSIVKHVMGRHEGQLTITSKLGQGAVFTCRFPAKRLVFNAQSQPVIL